MNPFYFGDSEKALFGVYHPPSGRTIRKVGIVICCPMGQEYMRAHRALRQLAGQLAKSGFDVLRFDYYGTGDSVGECDQGTVSQWQEDISTAIEELRETAEVQRIALVGLRFGGTLAALLGRERDDLESVVLWDPVIEGAGYIQEMFATDEFLEAYGTSAATYTSGVKAESGKSETVGIMGYPLTPEMRNDLAKIDLRKLEGIKAKKMSLIVSGDTEQFSQLRESLNTQAPLSSFQCIPSPGNWCEVDNFGSVLLPQEMIQGVANHLIQEF